MKIIFLDVDGVLNAPEFLEHFFWQISKKFGIKRKGKDYLFFEKRFVRKLEWIVKQTGAKIVISSVWRNTFTDWYQWLIVFTSMGFPNCGEAVIGTTRDLHKDFRGHEIDDWLASPTEGRWEAREVDSILQNYIILDDSRDFTENQLLQHLVPVKSRWGLTWSMARLSVRMLNRVGTKGLQPSIPWPRPKQRIHFESTD